MYNIHINSYVKLVVGKEEFCIKNSDSYCGNIYYDISKVEEFFNISDDISDLLENISVSEPIYYRRDSYEYDMAHALHELLSKCTSLSEIKVYYNKFLSEFKDGIEDVTILYEPSVERVPYSVLYHKDTSKICVIDFIIRSMLVLNRKCSFIEDDRIYSSVVKGRRQRHFATNYLKIASILGFEVNEYTYVINNCDVYDLYMNPILYVLDNLNVDDSFSCFGVKEFFSVLKMKKSWSRLVLRCPDFLTYRFEKMADSYLIVLGCRYETTIDSLKKNSKFVEDDTKILFNTLCSKYRLDSQYYEVSRRTLTNQKEFWIYVDVKKQIRDLFKED